MALALGTDRAGELRPVNALAGANCDRPLMACTSRFGYYAVDKVRASSSDQPPFGCQSERAWAFCK